MIVHKENSINKTSETLTLLALSDAFACSQWENLYHASRSSKHEKVGGGGISTSD
jgi:hypothetical protein